MSKKIVSKKPPTNTIVLNLGPPKRVPFSQHLKFETEEEEFKKTSPKNSNLRGPKRVPFSQHLKFEKEKEEFKKTSPKNSFREKEYRKTSPKKSFSEKEYRKTSPKKSKFGPPPQIAKKKKEEKKVVVASKQPKQKQGTASPKKTTSPQHKFYFSPESKYKKDLLLRLTKPTPFKLDQLPELLKNQPSSPPSKRGLTKVNLGEVFPKSKISLKYRAEKLNL